MPTWSTTDSNTVDNGHPRFHSRCPATATHRRGGAPRDRRMPSCSANLEASAGGAPLIARGCTPGIPFIGQPRAVENRMYQFTEWGRRSTTNLPELGGPYNPGPSCYNPRCAPLHDAWTPGARVPDSVRYPRWPLHHPDDYLRLTDVRTPPIMTSRRRRTFPGARGVICIDPLVVAAFRLCGRRPGSTTRCTPRLDFEFQATLIPHNGK
ncbi:hypothetical protein C8Q78DRAFT_443907 [Trametes maxima]|nr:hypothetical protein C8Q78DRAFT_443907 [Trametes maxima]